MGGVDEMHWSSSIPDPSVHTDDLPDAVPDEEQSALDTTPTRPDTRSMRVMNEINLMLCDSLRSMAQV